MSLPLRIAVADDEAFMREYLRTILPGLGHEVVASAEHGLELVERVRVTRPDLIVSDIDMPVMNGVEALRVISSEMAVPVVFVTGCAPDSDLVHASLVHVLLTKPVDAVQLQGGIGRVMRAFQWAFGLETGLAQKPSSVLEAYG